MLTMLLLCQVNNLALCYFYERFFVLLLSYFDGTQRCKHRRSNTPMFITSTMWIYLILHSKREKKNANCVIYAWVIRKIIIQLFSVHARSSKLNYSIIYSILHSSGFNFYENENFFEFDYERIQSKSCI